MNREAFNSLFAGKPLFLDGATGSNLVSRGMPSGVCPEQWVLEHREVMIGLQQEFLRAGSRILYAPTFTANRIKLKEYGLEDRIREMNLELVAVSKEAIAREKLEGSCFVAGDLTMTGEQLIPIGTMEFEDLIEIYKEQISFLAEAGADLLVIETMMSLQECRAALIAAKETCELPVIVTLTFEPDGRTLFGTDARTAAIVMESLGASAVGANCSTGPDKMKELIQTMAESVSIPVIAKPNAGLPALNSEGVTVYDMDADTFAEQMAGLVEAGASLLGGCCGTTPVYLERLIQKTQNLTTAKVLEIQEPGLGKRYLTSERKTLSFGLNDPFIIIGERINPTGKKKLQEELRNDCFDLVSEFAEQQEEDGAQILDINMGMSGIDEKEMMLKAIEEVTSVTTLPLSLDSSYVEVLEAALRRYPGRALVNSISYESAKLNELLPIVQKYGAMFILLPLSDAGLPKSIEEKIEIIEAIAQRAIQLGMKKEDIIVDGLVATVGASKNAAVETLETIRYCKQHGYATVCGLSNISFGLPQRGSLNAAFLTMAIQSGLTMAIANPSSALLMGSVYASDLLLAREEADLRYITYAGQPVSEPIMQRQPAQPVSEPIMQGQLAQPAPEQITYHQQVRDAVLKGNRKTIVALVTQALEEGTEPSLLLQQTLLPAINEVGDLFDKGTYFLPQLIASAEAMKKAIEYLEPMLMEDSGQEEMPVIIIATVAGDIHDIGKNLVALMLKNHGFQVIDLGKDVPRERIIEAAIEHKASIIALSALMTTTMQEMRRVIEYAREQNVTAKVIIGGAVITQEYADEIGADGYSRDAADAVKVVKKLLER